MAPSSLRNVLREGLDLVARTSALLLHTSETLTVISEALERTAGLIGAGQIALYENTEALSGEVVCIKQGGWSEQGMPVLPDMIPLRSIASDDLFFGSIRDVLIAGNPFQASTSELPAKLRELAWYHHVQSLALVPVLVQGALWGELVATSTVEPAGWDDDIVAVLQGVAHMLAIGAERWRDASSLGEMRTDRQLLFDNSLAGTILIKNDQIIGINGTALRMLSGTADGYIGKPFIETVMHPSCVLKARGRRAMMKGQQGVLPPTELVLRTEVGRAVDVFISATYAHRNDDIIISSTFVDISVLKMRERLLDALSRVASSLTSQYSLRAIMPQLKEALETAFPHAMLTGFLHCYPEGDADLIPGKEYARHHSHAETRSLLVCSRPLPAWLEEALLKLARRAHDKGPIIQNLHAPNEEALYQVALQSVVMEQAPKGFLILIEEAGRGISEFELGGLSILAESISNALLKIALSEESAMRFANLSVLYESSMAFSTLMSAQELADASLRILHEKKGWSWSVVRLRDERSRRLMTLSYHGPSAKGGDLDKKLQWMDMVIGQVGVGMTGWVIQHGSPVLCLDLPHDQRYVETDPGMRYGIYAPIQSEGNTIGAIGVESDTSLFTRADLQLLVSIGELLGIAITKINSHELLSQRVRWLERLYGLAAATTVESEPEILYDQLLQGAIDALHAETGSLFLYDAARQVLVLEAARGWLAQDSKYILPPQGLTGRVYTEGKACISWDLRHDPALMERSRSFIPEGKRAITVPVKAAGMVIGVFHLAFSARVPLDEEIVSVTELFASFAGMAIRRAQLIAALQTSNQALKAAYDATLEGWSRAIGLRDNETAYHGDRVTRIAVALGEAMELGPDMLESLRRGALLHDIGKIGIPDAILLKEGPLTPEERAIMHSHPVLAKNLLEPVDFLKDALVVPYCHHERWDGSGYPQGLRGEQISLLARIFSVADVYDAMTSNRPYRPALSEEEALTYIKSASGTHFDPAVVAAFLALREGEHL
ncbi:MAG: GAF domain-containing protein [Spirochaetales bacterium]|nr:GAF domain-containing protein [Spirochaetales bacterium]